MIGRDQLIRLTRQLVDAPSVTGQEKVVGDFVVERLSKEGWTCSRQTVSGDRFNVLATRGVPRVIFSTHLDTVPPFFASSEDDTHVYGRGACDAKGIAAAMICAAEQLAAEGRGDVALLFVVGEETESDGAAVASRLTPPVAFLVNGEPTDNELATGHKGTVLARIEAEGIAAHSGYPDRGDSAIARLIDVLQDLRNYAFPDDPLLGRPYLNIGAIQGGVAANVIPDSAEAVILIRTVAPSRVYVDRLKTIVGDRCRLVVSKASEPQTMLALPDFPTKVVGYGTDIPLLRSLGRPLLLGPGSIFDAHTPTEKVSKGELSRAVDLYVAVVKRLDGVV
jgi:acetylornithine deacetylase